MFQDPPSCTVLITTLPLPPMEQLLAQYMPSPPHPDGPGGGGTTAATRGSSSGTGPIVTAPPRPAAASAAGLVTETLGSKGPIRVCLPELEGAMARARLPLTRLPSGAGPDESTECLVADFSHALRLVCRRALLPALQQLQQQRGAGAGAEACVLAVRLGCDTPLDEYSVLLGVRGRTPGAVAQAVAAVSGGIAPLLC